MGPLDVSCGMKEKKKVDCYDRGVLFQTSDIYRFYMNNIVEIADVMFPPFQDKGKQVLLSTSNTKG